MFTVKKFIGLSILLLSLTATAQISVGRSHRGPFDDFKKGDYKIIKAKKTVFVIDDFNVPEFEKMLSSFWDLNKYIVVSREEYEHTKANYLTEEYAVFEFKGDVVTSSPAPGTSGITNEYLHLMYKYYYYSDIKVKNDKTKYDINEVAAIFFAGNAEGMWGMINSKTFYNLDENLYNYKLGFMKNYLQFVNTTLKDEWYSFAYATDYDKKKIKALKTSTLYIPDYIKIKYDAFKGTDSDREGPDELLKKYSYKYEFIDTDKLNEMILNAKEDFYYLMYTKVNSQKFISVVNGKTGEVIYREYDIMSYNIKAKDFSELSSSIK
ncbi:hypothetical protein [Flavobacterium aestuarii]|uniref:hypothetical protein n=1 Tax=Flavobacterium aestuarii TaxID=3149227 RepID=UPI0032B6112B